MPNLLVLLVPFFAVFTLAQSLDPVPHKACATLIIRENSTYIGNVSFIQTSPDSKVTVMGTLQGLDRNALRGMHIHESSNFSQGCNSTGVHFNPTNKTHGDRTDAIRHVGDLGNVQTDDNGTATFNFTVDMVSLFDSPNSVIGRALVIHSGTDDLGKGGQLDSNTTGHAGNRFACGLISTRAA